MKKVAILVLESSVMQAIADPQYCFSAVNQFLGFSGKPLLFDIKLVGLRKEVKLNEGKYSVHADLLISDLQMYDLVIIPALFGDLNAALDANAEFLPWIIQQRQQGAEIASLCLGAFLLASTGLIDGKKCSTHWGFVNEFRRKFPFVEVQDGSIVTEENGIYSSGGATSYWNLLLLASKYFAIDIDRSNQSAFMMFQGQKEHNDLEIQKAQNYIEQSIDGKLTVDELADLVALGRRSFERRFKAATNNSVLEYIQRVKIETAKRSFENSRKNINEVMMDVGYSDNKAFRTTFKKITGLTPIEYRNKYRKMA
jgi:transcriptional regulator GlxA family with amidase domain